MSMRMSRLILSRIATLSVLVLVVSIALVAWQAHRDVDHEARSARQVALLLDTLSQLQGASVDEIPGHLRAVDTILRSGQLRHLQIRIQDDSGRDLLVPMRPDDSPMQAWLFSMLSAVLPDRDDPPVRWTLRARDGHRFLVTLTTDPTSEQRESLVGILDLLSTLAVFGTLIVLGTYLSLRQVLAPMRGILRAIDGYRRGDYRRRAPSGNTDEINAIADALNHLACELAETQEARRALSKKLLTLQEDERAHLARELHDEFGQVLTAIRADAAWLARQVQDQPDVHAVAVELRAHCEQASLDVRHLLLQLRPRDAESGDGVPLRRMLQDLVDSWNARPGIDMRFMLDLDIADDALPESLALALYRISQEALTNAARHSRAATVRIAVSIDRDGVLHWTCSDDGVGMPGDASQQHGNGLIGMRERVWAHGGDIATGAAHAAGPRPGTSLHARFPMAVR